MSTTFYISAYALSSGIKEVQASDDGGTAWVTPQGYWSSYKLGTGIHRTKAEANAAAEVMRIKKIDSLKKQLARLEKLSFGESA